MGILKAIFRSKDKPENIFLDGGYYFLIGSSTAGKLYNIQGSSYNLDYTKRYLCK